MSDQRPAEQPPRPIKPDRAAPENNRQAHAKAVQPPEAEALKEPRRAPAKHPAALAPAAVPQAKAPAEAEAEAPKPLADNHQAAKARATAKERAMERRRKRINVPLPPSPWPLPCPAVLDSPSSLSGSLHLSDHSSRLARRIIRMSRETYRALNDKPGELSTKGISHRR